MKWGGAALAVLLAVLWIGSGWWTVGWVTSGGSVIGVRAGLICVGGQKPGSPAAPQCGFAFGYQPMPFRWTSSIVDSPTAWQDARPLWMPTLAVLLITVVAWRLDTLARRRARVNLCPKCNYDRAGLAPGAVCPECGTAPRLGP